MILESDCLFYYNLGMQFSKERKYKAALNTLQIYEMIMVEVT
jgi:hypothetical protein